MSYDPDCEILARHFLSDEKGVTEKQVKLLSQVIQDAVEDWLIYDDDSPVVEAKTFAAARAVARKFANRPNE